MAKKEELKNEVRTYRDVLNDMRNFCEDYDLFDKPFDGYGYIEKTEKVGNRSRTIQMTLSTGSITKTEIQVVKM